MECIQTYGCMNGCMGGACADLLAVSFVNR